ncbi:MAG: type II secretion system F family protein [Pirellulaceae bacterium]|nr:type II secretion system F family protein [Pirellulaceae bacterium]
MADFHYTARNSQGEKVNGTLTVSTKQDALSHLANQSLFPISVEPAKAEISINLFAGRVNGQTLATFYIQLSSLLKSGVPLLRALAVLRDQTTNNRLKETLDDIYSRVEDGTTLGDAMARHNSVFSSIGINMVIAGGEGGFLEDALRRVGHFTEQQEDLKSRTMGALAYPAILSLFGTIVVVALLIFVVPSFAPMFDSLAEKGALPWMTSALLAISDFCGKWWPLFVVLVAGFVFGFQYALTTEKGRYLFDLIKIKIPMAGSIFLSLAIARFCRVFGTTLQNGVPIVKAIEISKYSCGNAILSETITDAAESLSAGEPLATPLAKSGHFPQTITEMISVAEEANTLDSVLTETADALEERTNRRLDIMVKMLEPLMLMVMAGIVLCIVMALILPILLMGQTI